MKPQMNSTERMNLEKKETARLVEEGRAFFCSELIAKAYKCSKIMEPTEKACSNFLPASFTS